MGAHDLTARSAASRWLVACAASLEHQTVLGFVTRCSKPSATLEASFAYYPISFSWVFPQGLCNFQCTSLRPNSSSFHMFVRPLSRSRHSTRPSALPMPCCRGAPGTPRFAQAAAASAAVLWAGLSFNHSSRSLLLRFVLHSCPGLAQASCVFCGATSLVTHQGAATLPMRRNASAPTKSAILPLCSA